MDEGIIFIPVADILDGKFKNALYICSMNIKVQCGIFLIFPWLLKVMKSGCCVYSFVDSG